MKDAERLNLYLSRPVATRLREMAADEQVSCAALVRQALGVLQVMRDANRAGLYVGTAHDREALETLIVAP